MKILILSQYFWPETFIINDMARKLYDDGHEVTVATGKPNYPGGKIYPGYTASGIKKESFCGSIEVWRIPLVPRGRGSAVGLALNFLSFAAAGTLMLPWLLRKHRFDAVFVFAVSPLTAAIPAIAVGKLKKANVAIWIQDLWPQSLQATGFVTNKLILKSLELLVRAIYGLSDKLLVQSEAFIEPVAALAERRKITFLPNFAPEISSSGQLPHVVRDKMRNRFAIVFAGNLGKAQALDTILDAARHLQDQEEILFIIAGTGSEAERLQKRATELSLANVMFIGQLPQALMPDLYRCAAALLVTLRDDPALELTVPSKLQAYMQAGRPIIGALNGEGARIIEAAGAGVAGPAEDATILAKSILTLYSMAAIRREAMGSAGSAYFTAHYELSAVAKRLVDILATETEGKAQ